VYFYDFEVTQDCPIPALVLDVLLFNICFESLVLRKRVLQLIVFNVLLTFRQFYSQITVPYDCNLLL